MIFNFALIGIKERLGEYPDLSNEYGVYSLFFQDKEYLYSLTMENGYDEINEGSRRITSKR